ncbi:hypothetical protein D3C73_1636520 [compost metagenome]
MIASKASSMARTIPTMARLSPSSQSTCPFDSLHPATKAKSFKATLAGMIRQARRQ